MIFSKINIDTPLKGKISWNYQMFSVQITLALFSEKRDKIILSAMKFMVPIKLNCCAAVFVKPDFLNDVIQFSSACIPTKTQLPK